MVSPWETLLPNYTSVIPLVRVIRTPTGRERATCRAYVLRRHTIPSSRSAIGPAHRSLSAFPLTPAPPPSRRSRSSLAKAASILPTRTLSSSSVLQPRPTTSYGLRRARLAFWATNPSVFTCRYSYALGSCHHMPSSASYQKMGSIGEHRGAVVL